LAGRAGLGREELLVGIGGRALEEHVDDVVPPATHASVIVTRLFLLIKKPT
jgi:hypothetical protein